MQRKAEVDIGYRAFKFIIDYSIKHDMSVYKAIHALGVGEKVAYSWQAGTCPSAKYLQFLVGRGADANWILTGHSLHESKSEVGGR